MKKTALVDVENKAPEVGVLCGLETSDINEKATNMLETLNKFTEEKNKTFAKMNKFEKRVALAKDVLASLKAKRYIAEAGTYVSIYEKGEYKDISSVNISELNNTGVECTVCAIGSLFLSNKKQQAGKKLTDADGSIMSKSLRGIFTEKEMRMLEYMFEGEDVGNLFHGVKTTLAKDMDSFYEKYNPHGNSDYDEKTLKAIMNNIIRNNGNFIYKSVKI